MNDEPGRGERGNGLFLTAVALFILIALLCRSSFACWINTDATAYISIARQYLAGGFARAVSGYWGPLLSWLMIPLLALDIPGLVAARLVQLAAGLAALFAVRRLAVRLGATPRSAGALGLCLAVPLANYSLRVVSPDILLLLLVVTYCGFVLPSTYRGRSAQGAVAGAIGGLAYLAKSYALPFFLAHFGLMNLLHFVRAAKDPDPAAYRRRVMRHFAAGLLAFVIVAGPWIAVLTHKYGHFTVGTSGQRAYALVGPHYIGDDPVFTTLIPPPSFDAPSYWNDPAVVQMTPWSPLESKAMFRHQIKVFGGNLRTTLHDFAVLFPFALVTLVYFAGVALRPHDTQADPNTVTGLAAAFPATAALRDAALPLLLTVALYAGGYMPMFVELRYLWPVIVLLVLMTILLFQQFMSAARSGSAAWAFLVVWLAVSCSVVPLNDLLSKPDRGRDALELATRLSREFKVQGNLASNDRWSLSLFSAFHMRARYFGRVPEDLLADEERLLAALRSNAIDYYLVWGEESGLAKGPFINTPVPEVTGGRIRGLRVYAIKTPPAPAASPKSAE